MEKDIQIIIEEGDNEWWGRITSIENFLPVSDTIPELIKNIKGLLQDWQLHEGKEDQVWNKVDFNDVKFEIVEQKEAE